MNLKLLKAFFLLTAIFLLIGGHTDLDWQLVRYRYSAYARSLDHWEFNPYLKVNWWIAFQFSLWRIMVGWAAIGFLLGTEHGGKRR